MPGHPDGGARSLTLSQSCDREGLGSGHHAASTQREEAGSSSGGPPPSLRVLQRECTKAAEEGEGQASC